MAELFRCDRGVVNDKEAIEKIMNSAAQICGATVVESVFHLFNPHGISGVVVIAESHLAIHTWPEFGYAAVDIFTCGETVNPWKALDYVRQVLKAEKVSVMELNRGEFDPENGQLLPRPPVVVRESGRAWI